MLSKREDYTFVQIPPTMQIDGGILPLREGTEKYQLRGEDVCFLTEYQRRFQKAFSIGTPSTMQMDHRIVGSRLQNIILHNSYWYSKPGGRLIRPEATFETRYVFRGNQGYTYFPSELNPFSAIPESAFKGDWYAFQSGQPLRLQPLQDIFDDMRFFQRVETSFSQSYNWGYFNGYNVHNDGDGSKVPSRHMPEWPYVFRYRTASYYDDQDNKHWAGKTWTMANSGSMRYTIGLDRFKYIKSEALIQVYFTLSRSWHTSSSSTRSNSDMTTYIYMYPARRQGDAFEISPSWVYNTVEQLKNQNGLGDGQSRNPGGWSTDGSNGVFQADIQISLGLAAGVFYFDVTDLKWWE